MRSWSASIWIRPWARRCADAHRLLVERYGSQSQSDPILRGVRISLDIICSALPAPPNDIPPLPALLDSQNQSTARRGLDQQAALLHLPRGVHQPARLRAPRTTTRSASGAIPITVSPWQQRRELRALDGRTTGYNGLVELSQLLAESPSVPLLLEKLAGIRAGPKARSRRGSRARHGHAGGFAGTGLTWRGWPIVQDQGARSLPMPVPRRSW